MVDLPANRPGLCDQPSGEKSQSREAAGKLRPFGIRVVDQATGRGVPLVELTTVNAIRLVTDSNGWAAFLEPDLLGQEVFFFVRSHGYEFPQDGFGYAGVRLRVVPGGTATISMRRKNIAERLYRITGQGIYRDSILLGQRVPEGYRPLAGGVLGCDSVLTAIFRGQLYWFWGDTQRASYPLGNFWTTGARSPLADTGQIDPAEGIPFEYFVGADGFVRPVAPISRAGPVWLNGPIVLGKNTQHERMFAHYAVIDPKSQSFEALERGLAVFDPEEQLFLSVAKFPPEALFPDGAHPIILGEGEEAYVYFCNPFPLLRVRADESCLQDPACYESFTPLRPASRVKDQLVDLSEARSVCWGWKKATDYLNPIQLDDWVKRGLLPREEARLLLFDVFTGTPVLAHRGTCEWNNFRRCFVMIFTQFAGTSFLGEVWYAESDSLLGPWGYAQKIVTHERYSFYNPKHHPYFDQHGGRLIYFEGTYTASFSDAALTTPYYEYNQIMYRLDLAQEALRLPVPVYEISAEDGRRIWATRWTIPAEETKPDRPRLGVPGPVCFWAWDRSIPDAIPIYLVRDDNGNYRLSTVASKRRAETSRPICYVLSLDGVWSPGELTARTGAGIAGRGDAGDKHGSKFAGPQPVPLWEWQNADGSVVYRCESDPPPNARPVQVLGKVFPHPGRRSEAPSGR